MSKGKYARKRRRAEERAKQERANPNLALQHSVEDKDKGNAAYPSQNNAQAKGKTTMAMPEFIKRSSITDWLLAAFTLALTVTALYQYRITNSQLDVMQNDERAWMTFEPYDASAPKETMGEIIEGKPIEFTLKSSNTGKTPAVNVREQAILVLVKTGDHTPLELLNDTNRGYVLEGGIIMPNNRIEEVITRTEGTTPGGEPATAAEALSIGSLKMHMVVFGRIEYTDIFHEKHWTQFCKYVTGLPTRECAQYNSSDPN